MCVCVCVHTRLFLFLNSGKCITVLFLLFAVSTCINHERSNLTVNKQTLTLNACIHIICFFFSSTSRLKIKQTREESTDCILFIFNLHTSKDSSISKKGLKSVDCRRTSCRKVEKGILMDDL